MLQQRPNTFAQTILSLSFFACDKAADHIFLFADDTPGMCRARTALLRVARLSGAILIGGPSGEFLPGRI